MGTDNLPKKRGGQKGNKGGGRNKSITVKTASEFKAAHVSELPGIWDSIIAIENDPATPISEKLRSKHWRFEQLAGRAAQAMQLQDGEGQPVSFAIINFKGASANNPTV